MTWKPVDNPREIDGSSFFNRSAYRFPEYELPDCFVRLGQRFEQRRLRSPEVSLTSTLAISQNLCRRLGYVDVLAKVIETTLLDTRIGAFGQSELVSGFLVSHFGACKSVLDAVAISLNHVYGLGLTGGNLDMHKHVFWSTLMSRAAFREHDYNTHRPLIDSVTKWRDEAVHRIPPLVIVSGAGHPASVPTPKPNVTLCLVLGITTEQFFNLNKSGYRADKFGHPLHFHRLWRSSLEELCSLACDDIATHM